jgi:hypothetical protein
VLSKQAEIWIAAPELLSELLPQLILLHAREATFSGAEPHDRELILLAGLQP